MILGFKRQFPGKILLGDKIHTIRIDKYNRWKPGRLINFAMGVRTKEYYEFKKDTCISTQKIKISYNPGGGVNVFIDDLFFHYQTSWGLAWTPETKSKMDDLARSDGFNSISEFFKWFNKDFEGKIIHWTNKRY